MFAKMAYRQISTGEVFQLVKETEHLVVLVSPHRILNVRLYDFIRQFKLVG